MNKRVNTWAAAHPQTLRFFNDLNREDIPWGVFSGLAVHFLGGRPATADTDLLIPDGRLEEVAEILPGSRLERKDVEIQSSDGVTLKYETDELTAVLDGTEVQIMQPTTPITDGLHRYRLALTELAAAHRTKYDVQGTDVYVAHDFDTLGAKAIFQRDIEQGKHDMHDTRVLIRNCDPLSAYAIQRAHEMGLDERATRFMYACGMVAVSETVDAAYLLAA